MIFNNVLQLILSSSLQIFVWRYHWRNQTYPLKLTWRPAGLGTCLWCLGRTLKQKKEVKSKLPLT